MFLPRPIKQVNKQTKKRILFRMTLPSVEGISIINYYHYYYLLFISIFYLLLLIIISLHYP